MTSITELLDRFEQAVIAQQVLRHTTTCVPSNFQLEQSRQETATAKAVLLEAMPPDLAQMVDEAVQKMGGYWPVPKIEDRLVEEVGEIFKERAKGTPAGKIREAGDLLFTNLAYLNAHDVNVGDLLTSTIHLSLEKAKKS